MTTDGAVPPPTSLNLHSHLEGSVRPQTAAELAVGLGLDAPVGGWDRALHMADRGTLTTFLGHVAHAYPLFANRDAVHRIVTEAIEDAERDGVAYLELRFGPATHVSEEMPLRAVVEAACDAVSDARGRIVMPAGLIVCALRHHDADTNTAAALVAAEFAGRGVVGFDVAGDELIYPSLEPMRAPFAIAAAAGLGLTAHAAEAGPATAVRDAVEVLGATRIGHGSRAAEDPGLLAWAADRGVCFEVCPTSNILTGAAPSYAQHPVRAFLAAGCEVVVGDDDPTTTGSRLANELALLNEAIGLEPDVIRRIHGTSVARAFCEPSVRASIEGRTSAITGSPTV